MYTQQEVAAKLKSVFDEHKLGDLTREDIGVIETHQNAFAKYINAYRVSLLVQKAYDVGNETELTAKINLCNNILSEILIGLEQKRRAYDEEQAAIALQKERDKI